MSILTIGGKTRTIFDSALWPAWLLSPIVSAYWGRMEAALLLGAIAAPQTLGVAEAATDT
jgi:hypothetical protein